MYMHRVLVIVFIAFVGTVSACATTVVPLGEDDAGVDSGGASVDAGSDARTDARTDASADARRDASARTDSGDSCTCAPPQAKNPADCPTVQNATVLPRKACPTLGLTCEYADDTACACGDRIVCVAGADGGGLVWGGITRVP